MLKILGFGLFGKGLLNCARNKLHVNQLVNSVVETPLKQSQRSSSRSREPEKYIVMHTLRPGEHFQHIRFSEVLGDTEKPLGEALDLSLLQSSGVVSDISCQVVMSSEYKYSKRYHDFPFGAVQLSDIYGIEIGNFTSSESGNLCIHHGDLVRDSKRVYLLGRTLGASGSAVNNCGSTFIVSKVSNNLDTLVKKEGNHRKVLPWLLGAGGVLLLREKYGDIQFQGF